jgi:hypothetical protein
MLRLALVMAVLVSCGKRSHEKSSSGSGGSAVSDVAGRKTEQQPAPEIVTFWTWFAQHAAELKAEPDLQKAMERISDETAKIDPDLIGEVALEGNTRQLVLSADGKRELFPKVQAVYAARPGHIDGWSVIAFRPRDKAIDGMTIDMGKHTVEAKQVKFVAEPADHKLDVVVYIPHFTTVDEMGSLGFILLDHTVGEYDMETKIGGVDFASLDDAPKTAKPLNELPAAVDALR